MLALEFLFDIKAISCPSLIDCQSKNRRHGATHIHSTPPSDSQKPKEDMSPRTPIYFISHGGPDACHDTSHPVYTKLNALGKEIASLNSKPNPPRALLIFSAHWESDAGAGTIQVSNPSAPLPLIYDFYGFPAHYYKTRFPHRVDSEVGRRVVEVLNEGGIPATEVQRGLDHGVWVPLLVMFDGREEKMLPVVQVSLFPSESGDEHLRLGRVVAKLREEGVVIIVSGMAVHNLGDFARMRGNPTPAGYTLSFDEALRQAVESEPGEVRDGKMGDLLRRDDTRKAHPTLEHLLPVHIGVGAAGEDQGQRIWTMGEASVSWAQFRFGRVES